MKISPRRPASRAPVDEKDAEPLFLWWMPIAGLLLAAGWGIWKAADTSDGSAGDRLAAFGAGFLWPGFAIFAVTTFLVWLAWKVEFE